MLPYYISILIRNSQIFEIIWYSTKFQDPIIFKRNTLNSNQTYSSHLTKRYIWRVFLT